MTERVPRGPNFLFGNINYLQTKYDEALKALEKSRHLLTTEVKNETLRADVLSHIAAIYLYRGKQERELPTPRGMPFGGATTGSTEARRSVLKGHRRPLLLPRRFRHRLPVL